MVTFLALTAARIDAVKASRPLLPSAKWLPRPPVGGRGLASSGQDDVDVGDAIKDETGILVRNKLHSVVSDLGNRGHYWYILNLSGVTKPVSVTTI